MYSIYAPNTADDMVYPGLYRLNGITVGSNPNFYGYAIVMSSLDHTIIKQLIYHNASNGSLLRYRFNNQWTDFGEFALKDDLPVYRSVIVDPSGNDYVDISVPGIQSSWAPIVFNGDHNAWHGYVESIYVDESNSILRAHLSEARTGTTRLNYTYKKQST